MAIHAVADWLEKIYSVPATRMSQDNSPFASKNLERVFELLRGGKLILAQKELEEVGEYEKYMWLMGSEPLFDNSESVSTCQGLLPVLQEHHDILEHVERRASEGQAHVVTGNRTNLLFVQTCIEKIKSTRSSYGVRQDEVDQELFENAILGLQIGHIGALDKLLEQRRQDNSGFYKDNLWATFRAAAV